MKTSLVFFPHESISLKMTFFEIGTNVHLREELILGVKGSSLKARQVFLWSLDLSLYVQRL